MSPDLPEKILDIPLDGPDDREPSPPDEAARDEVAYERFFFFRVGGHRLAVEVDDVRTVLDPPETIIPVPRTPQAVEGITDVRGEITAVVDPLVHFTVEAESADRGTTRGEPAGDDSTGAAVADDESTDDRPLLLLDRPSDEQPAAIRVEAVEGVHSVPEESVLDASGVVSREFDGGALEHPLVVALIERERAYDESGAEITIDDPSVIGSGIPTVRPGPSDDRLVDVSFDPSEEPEAGRATPRRVVVEVTPFVDVDRLLYASGGRSEPVPVDSA